MFWLHFQLRSHDADSSDGLHKVSPSSAFVAAVRAYELLPGRLEIDSEVTQHQNQQIALHRLGHFEQAQGRSLLGLSLRQPALPEADLEQSNKNQLGIDQRLDLRLGAGGHLAQGKVTLPGLENRFDTPAQA